MRRQSVAATLCFLVVLGFAAPLPSGAVVATASGEAAGPNGTDAGERRGDALQERNNTTLGESISSFMQVSAVETEGSLDREMWTAAYRHASSETARARLLAQRLDALETRLDALEARLSNGANASAAAPSSLVRAVVLAAEAASLRRTIAATASVVGDRNETEVSGLAELSERAEALDEPTVPSVPGAGVVDGRPSPPSHANGTGPSDTPAPGEATGTDGPGRPGNAAGNGTDTVGNATDRPAVFPNGTAVGNATPNTGGNPSPDSNRSDDGITDGAPAVGTGNGNGNENGIGTGNGNGNGAGADTGDDGTAENASVPGTNDGGTSGTGTPDASDGENAPDDGTAPDGDPRRGNGTGATGGAGGSSDPGNAAGSGSNGSNTGGEEAPTGAQ